MTTLPPPIVAALDALGSDLVSWAAVHRDSTLADQEQAVLERVRAALPRLLAAVLTLSTRQLDPGLRGLPQRCPTCAQRCRVQSWRRRRVTTICGRVAWERPWYVCRGCGPGWSPLDQTLGVAPRARLSAGVQQWLAELGAATDFADAPEWLEQLGGVHVAKEPVRAPAERQGAALEAAQQTACAQVERTRESALPVEAAPGQLLVETDGVMVRYRETGWHEVKIGLVAGWEAGALAAPSYLAARGAGDRGLGRGAPRRGPGRLARRAGARGWRPLDLDARGRALRGAARARGLLPRQRTAVDRGAPAGER